MGCTASSPALVLGHLCAVVTCKPSWAGRPRMAYSPCLGEELAVEGTLPAASYTLVPTGSSAPLSLQWA